MAWFLSLKVRVRVDSSSQEFRKLPLGVGSSCHHVRTAVCRCSKVTSRLWVLFRNFISKPIVHFSGFLAIGGRTGLSVSIPWGWNRTHYILNLWNHSLGLIAVLIALFIWLCNIDIIESISCESLMLNSLVKVSSVSRILSCLGIAFSWA